MIGSIPAPAGEPPNATGVRFVQEVYPRACGGTLPLHYLHALSGGLSPRLRGNHAVPVNRPHTAGSIPAPAGEPLALRRNRRGLSVYPRACGGTHLANGNGCGH